MPQSTQRSILLANIIKMMEQLIRLIEYHSGNDLIKLLEELWVVYKTISECRYIVAVRGEGIYIMELVEYRSSKI